MEENEPSPNGAESKKTTISQFNMNPQLTTMNNPNKFVLNENSISSNAAQQPTIEVKGDISKKPSVKSKKYDRTKSPVRLAMLSENTQTDQASFVNFACEMFMRALEAEAHNGEEEEEKYQDLLKKAEHIIIKIRSKAATSYGLVGGGGFGFGMQDIASVLASKPMSPSRY